MDVFSVILFCEAMIQSCQLIGKCSDEHKAIIMSCMSHPYTSSGVIVCIDVSDCVDHTDVL